MNKITDSLEGEYREATSTSEKSLAQVGREVIGNLILFPHQELDEEKLLQVLRYASERAHFHVIKEISRKNSQTLSAAAILHESHFSLHYLPQSLEMWVDIFTCGQEGNPRAGKYWLEEKLNPQQSHFRYLLR